MRGNPPVDLCRVTFWMRKAQSASCFAVMSSSWDAHGHHFLWTSAFGDTLSSRE